MWLTFITCVYPQIFADDVVAPGTAAQVVVGFRPLSMGTAQSSAAHLVDRIAGHIYHAGDRFNVLLSIRVDHHTVVRLARAISMASS